MKRAVLLGATVILVLLLAAPSYADVLLTAADWQMNETSGQMTDSSGNENNGDPTDVRQTGSRYVFNGSTSYVAVPEATGTTSVSCGRVASTPRPLLPL